MNDPCSIVEWTMMKNVVKVLSLNLLRKICERFGEISVTQLLWWRIVEDLYQVCIKFVMSVWTLLDRFSKIIRWRCEVLFSIFE